MDWDTLSKIIVAILGAGSIAGWAAYVRARGQNQGEQEGRWLDRIKHLEELDKSKQDRLDQQELQMRDLLRENAEVKGIQQVVLLREAQHSNQVQVLVESNSHFERENNKLRIEMLELKSEYMQCIQVSMDHAQHITQQTQLIFEQAREIDTLKRENFEMDYRLQWLEKRFAHLDSLDGIRPEDVFGELGDG